MKRAAILALLLSLAGSPVLAQTPTPGFDTVYITVLNSSGQLSVADEIGCAWSPLSFIGDGYSYVPQCTNCSQAVCTFSHSEHTVMGGYFVSEDFDGFGALNADNYEVSHSEDALSGNLEDLNAGDPDHYYTLWGTSTEWTEPHYLTVTVSSLVVVYSTPTPVPTLTPIPKITSVPTLGPPPTVDVSAGMSSTFTLVHREMSGAGILPDFGATIGQWLFWAQKTVDIVNQGNLLFVVGGILLATLVIGWVIDRVKNPR